MSCKRYWVYVKNLYTSSCSFNLTVNCTCYGNYYLSVLNSVTILSLLWHWCVNSFLQVEYIFSANLTIAQILEQSAFITTQLTIATDTSGTSLLPSELSITNTILSKLIDVLESSVSTGTVPANEVHADTCIICSSWSLNYKNYSCRP